MECSALIRVWHILLQAGQIGISNAAASLDRSLTALCQDCKQTFALFSEGARGWNTRPHRQCITCYRGRRVRRSGASPRVDANPAPTSGIGGVFAQVSSQNASCGDKRQSPQRRRRSRHRRGGRDHRRARFLNHPEVKLTMPVNGSDYQAFRRSCPIVAQTAITTMADTGAHSCLCSMTGFLAAGFTPSDLIPVYLDLVAANTSPTKFAGAITLRLQAIQ